MATQPAAASGTAAIFALYRAILRLHAQRLPPPMRAMGDEFARSEFRRHLRGKTSEEQWRAFAVEWQRYTAMLGGTADQQAAFASATAAPADSQTGGSCRSAVGGAAQQQQQDAAGLASITAAIAAGSGDMTEALLTHMTADQRRQLIKLQQEALALGADMLGKSEVAEQLGKPASEPAGGKA